jgi:serine/threonine protein kinase
LLLQGSCHRDVKPDNIVLNKDTGVAGLIDFGCMMRLDGSDYHRGFTLSYLPPELAVPEILQDDEACRAVTSCKMDTYNMGFLGMHMIFDLPQQVDITEYNPDDEASLASYLGHIRTFDWSPQLEWLRDNGLGDLADLLAAFLAKDPALRPTAAEALQMRFLADVADEVGEAIARATPGFVVEQQAAVAMLEGLRGQPCTFVAEQLYSNTCSYSACYSSSYDCNSSNSSYCGSAATACCSDEQAAALLAAKSVLQSMACSSNCTTSSSIVPDTPCVNSARHSCSSSIAEENSMASNSSSSTCNIVQQPPAAEPMAAAVYVIEQQHQQPQSIVETPQAVQPPAAAVCESGQQKQQKSGVLQRAAEFMMCMVWEVTFSG